MARISDTHAQFMGDVSLLGYRFRSFTQSIGFAEFGTGASDTIALADFPLGVIPIRARVEITAEFAGEADLAVIIGDTSDPNGLMEVVTIHDIDVGTILERAGAEQGWGGYEADMADAGLVATFTATQLDDVTAGALTVRILYLEPVAVI